MKNKINSAYVIISAATLVISSALLIFAFKEKMGALASSAYVKIFFQETAAKAGLIIILLLAASSAIFSKITARILKPLYETSPIENLRHKAITDMLPLEKDLLMQEELKAKANQKFQNEKNKIAMVISNMTEGIIILDREKKIIVINAKTVDLFNLPDRKYIGKNFLVLSRDKTYIDTIDQAYIGKTVSDYIDTGKLKLRIYTAPVIEKNEVTAVFCLLTDRTDLFEKEKLRSEFTANISHELKTPLTSILGYADLISQDFVKNTDIKDFSAKIKQQADILLNMINDIIKLSHMDYIGNCAKEKFDLTALVNASAGNFKIIAQSKEVKLECFAEENIVINANQSMVADIINNLIKNAIDYNKPGGSVRITLCQTDEAVIFTCEDTGIGISDENKAHIFERFYTVDKSRSKKTGGTGLGLSIVKHAAIANGAKINLESELDKGSKFTVKFPKE